MRSTTKKRARAAPRREPLVVSQDVPGLVVLRVPDPGEARSVATALRIVEEGAQALWDVVHNARGGSKAERARVAHVKDALDLATEHAAADEALPRCPEHKGAMVPGMRFCEGCQRAIETRAARSAKKGKR